MTIEKLTDMQFEPCAGFRASDQDDGVCRCGWLDDDHSISALAVVVPVTRRRPRVKIPERRAS